MLVLSLYRTQIQITFFFSSKRVLDRHCRIILIFDLKEPLMHGFIQNPSGLEIEERFSSTCFSKLALILVLFLSFSDDLLMMLTLFFKIVFKESAQNILYFGLGCSLFLKWK